MEEPILGTLLRRMDSDTDSEDNLSILIHEDVGFAGRWLPRTAIPATWFRHFTMIYQRLRC